MASTIFPVIVATFTLLVSVTGQTTPDRFVWVASEFARKYLERIPPLSYEGTAGLETTYSPSYLCRAPYMDIMIPGKVTVEVDFIEGAIPACYITVNGTVLKLGTDYDILWAPPNSLEWGGENIDRLVSIDRNGTRYVRASLCLSWEVSP